MAAARKKRAPEGRGGSSGADVAAGPGASPERDPVRERSPGSRGTAIREVEGEFASDLPDEAILQLEGEPRSVGLSAADLDTQIAPAQAAGEETDPELAGGDIDSGETATGSGEEAPGGSTPTPDQDTVEGIGKALGVSYGDTEPLHTTDKIEKRDVNRWELDPASSEDFEERTRSAHAMPEKRRARGGR